MIEQFLLDLAKLIVGVCVGTYLGVKITKAEFKKEISSYLTNELPHLLASPKTELQIRKYAHIFFQELIKIITEEEKPDEQAEDRKVHEKRGPRTRARSQLGSEQKLSLRKAQRRDA